LSLNQNSELEVVYLQFNLFVIDKNHDTISFDLLIDFVEIGIVKSF